MICSSLCRVPFMAVLLSWVWENSHSKRSSFWGLLQIEVTQSLRFAVMSIASQLRAIETADLERRIAKLENHWRMRQTGEN